MQPSSANLVSAVSLACRRQESLVRDGLFTFVVLPVEPFNAPGSIDEFLLASEESVTLERIFQANLTSLGGPSLEGLATSADNVHFYVFGMNLFFMNQSST